MDTNKVWFVTGAGRGMGLDITKAALDAGCKVVATGRNVEKVTNAIGLESDNLLIEKLDITKSDEAEEAVRRAIDKFGRIDVLVNNAASFYAGFFEELTMEQIGNQLNTSLLGPMLVTRAILPAMRRQKSGHIISISSTAGLASFDFCSAYSASKFGLEGWMLALQSELAPFGITTTTVNPGFFRTELLTEESTNYAEAKFTDYDERRQQQEEFWKGANGKQQNDPAKLAEALIKIAAEAEPPARFLAGEDAIVLAEQVVSTLKGQIESHRELSSSLAFQQDE